MCCEILHCRNSLWSSRSVRSVHWACISFVPHLITLKTDYMVCIPVSSPWLSALICCVVSQSTITTLYWCCYCTSVCLAVIWLVCIRFVANAINLFLMVISWIAMNFEVIIWHLSHFFQTKFPLFFQKYLQGFVTCQEILISQDHFLYAFICWLKTGHFMPFFQIAF